MTQNIQAPSTWWGQFALDEGQTAHWEIGPLKLAIWRGSHEWRIAYERDETADPEATDWVYHPAAASIRELNYEDVERYVLDQTSETLWLRPVLADRHIITRPAHPLYVPAGEETTIFVSSPLWLRVAVGDPQKTIRELPIERPSDTWFGPSTMEGELCYASTTNARLNLANIPVLVHRAITAVKIGNRASTQLLIDRLDLPVPFLSLFATNDGLLWTQAVSLERTKDTEMATFQVEAGPPRAAEKATIVGEPRLPPEPKMSLRAFGELFRKSSWGI